jgi:AcrR family transcriptional regulator
MTTAASPGAVEHGDGRTERWAAHRDQRRETFVAAAIAAIRRHGAGVSMDEIAATAGVNKAVLYRHFRDRSELHAAVGRRLVGHVRRVVAAALDESRPLLHQVFAAVDAYLALIQAEPELYRFVHRRAAAGVRGNADPVADYTELMGRVVGDALAMRLPGRRVAAADVETWGHAIVGLVHTAGDRWLAAGARDRRTLSGQLSALIWGGLRQPTAAARYTSTISAPHERHAVAGAAVMPSHASQKNMRP